MKRTGIKSLLIGIGVFVIPFVCMAQKHYAPGYIIKNNMERIEGEVEILGDIFNAQYVNFNDGKTLVRYAPEQINAWGIEDKRVFASRTIIEDEEGKAVFLECIIKGHTSLLTYTAENQEIRYFIQKGDDQIRELKMGRRVNDQGQEVVYQEYLGVLRILFNDCEEIQEQIPSTSFGMPGLKKIVENYNNCIDPEGVYFERKMKGENMFDFEVLLGYNFPGFKITKNDKDKPYIYLEETTVEAKSYISFGVNFCVNVQKLKGASASLGVMYGKWEYDAIYEQEYDPPWDLQQVIYAYNYSIITIPVMVGYRFSLNKFKPFVMAGYSYSIIPKNKMKQISKIYYTDGNITTYKSEPNIVFKSRHNGLEAGIGMNYELLKFADIHFEVRYQQGKSDGFPGDANTPDISYLTLHSKTIYVLIGLSF